MSYNIFLPTQLDGYYLFKRRIVSFQVTDFHVRAILSMVKGRSQTVLQQFEQTFEAVEKESKDTMIASAIDTILQAVGKYDEVYVNLPSSYVTTKKLNLPFTDPDKIRMILPYEVEPLVPFSQDQIAVDAIINTKQQTEGQASVIAVVVPRAQLNAYLRPFMAQGIVPARISTSIVDLFGLIKKTYASSIKDKIVALIDVGNYETSVTVIDHGNFAYARTIPSGLRAASSNLAPNDADIGKELTEGLTELGQAIDITLRDHNVSESLLIGHGADIPSLDTLLSQILGMPCTPYKSSQFLQKGPASAIKNMKLSPDYLHSFATSVVQTETTSLNLGRSLLVPAQQKTITYQFFAGLIILVSILVGLLGVTLYQKARLNAQAYAMEQSAITKLQKLFPKQLKGRKRFSDIIQAAQFTVNREEGIVSAVTQHNRTPFLVYLQALFQSIDRVSLGLDVKRLKIDRDSVIFDGSVKGYPELKILEKEINSSGLFTLTNTPQETSFSVTLILNKELGE